MRLLLDQGLPRSAVFHLAQKGIDSQHTGDCGLATADDSTILSRAREEGSIVVTLDSDFHTQLALSRANTPSVIRIRIEGLRGEEMAAVVAQVVRVCEKDLQDGLQRRDTTHAPPAARTSFPAMKTRRGAAAISNSDRWEAFLHRESGRSQGNNLITRLSTEALTGFLSRSAQGSRMWDRKTPAFASDRSYRLRERRSPCLVGHA